jgi:peptidylprolyl isomerase
MRMSNTKTIIIFIIVFLLIVGGVFIYYKTDILKKTSDDEKMEKTKVLLKTNKGDILIELFDNSPITTENFINHVKKGTYDDVIFHRVIADFMIQGGDPTGTGLGDRSISPIKDEYISGNSNLRGTIAMANAGPNTGSTQFFINLKDNTFLDWDKEPLSSKHPVFGKVIEGMDIVDSIALVETDNNDRPVEEIRIIKAGIVER